MDRQMLLIIHVRRDYTREIAPLDLATWTLWVASWWTDGEEILTRGAPGNTRRGEGVDGEYKQLFE